MTLPTYLPADIKGRLDWVKAPAATAGHADAQVEETVRRVVLEVRARGDAAVRDFTQEFDGITVDALRVSDDEISAAVEALNPDTRADTLFAIANVSAFARAQLATMLPLEIETLPGVHLGHRIIPIHTVGAYVPGGRYPLLSAPVMTIVPAKIAGCTTVIACLPPTAHPDMIAGCHLSGADMIFRIGGAQAIAAMAFGTESVPKVDKIVGPGNAFVNEAKRQVFGPVGIDQLAGPSEIYVLADDSGDARMIAADLLAQAEHDVRTRVGLVTTSRRLAKEVVSEVAAQLKTLSTAAVAGAAWETAGEVVVCADEATMIAYSDHVAAEHLQVHTRNPKELAARLTNYGSLFLGTQASVVYSDKCSGTNHTLPTMGAARYTGGLWVGSFVKVCTHQWMTDEGVARVAPSAVRQSTTEGMDGHRRAAALRMGNDGPQAVDHLTFGG